MKAVELSGGIEIFRVFSGGYGALAFSPGLQLSPAMTLVMGVLYLSSFSIITNNNFYLSRSRFVVASDGPAGVILDLSHSMRAFLWNGDINFHCF